MSARQRESPFVNSDLAEIESEHQRERQPGMALEAGKEEGRKDKAATAHRAAEQKPRGHGGARLKVKNYHHPQNAAAKLLQLPTPEAMKRSQSDQHSRKLGGNVWIGKSTMFQKNQEAFASSKPASRDAGELSEGRPGLAYSASHRSLQSTIYTVSRGPSARAKAERAPGQSGLAVTLRSKPRQRSQEDLQASREFADYIVRKIQEQPDPSAVHALLDSSVKHKR